MSMEKEKSQVPKVSIGPEGEEPVSHLSRRSFLSRLGATGAAAATAGPLLGLAQTQFSQAQLQQTQAQIQYAAAKYQYRIAQSVLRFQIAAP